jgi:carbon-monoxide dehydrogenase small subunit
MHELGAYPSAVLLDVLRNDLGLIGTKRGCDMGTCGCCNVIIDGLAMSSCLVLAFDCVGKEVQTIESLAPASLSDLHPLQEAWAMTGGSQCGFCSPGFIMTSLAFLEAELREGTDLPSQQQIREAISGNLCRCTGYKKIVEAIEIASRQMAAREETSV